MTYEITKKNIKYLVLRVDKDGKIKVSAPKYQTRENIARFVELHKFWIESRLKKIQKYEDSARVKYFEKTYILRVLRAENGAKCGVCEVLDSSESRESCESFESHESHESRESSGESLESSSANLESTLKITAKNPRDSREIKKIVLGYFAKITQGAIDSIVESHKSTINRQIQAIRFREMTSKWGSCNFKTAKITLNTALFSYPRECFEYVLCHELAHLLVPNHGREFYALLGRLYPRWREAKRILKE